MAGVDRDFASQAPSARQSVLRGSAIGLPGVLFQSITGMAPAIAVAFSIPAGVVFAGGATPLAVLLALVACIFVALSIWQLAKHLPSAGSFYTYTSKALHPAVGFLVGWGYSFAVILIGPFIAVQAGFIVGGTLNSEFGVSNPLWWPWVIFIGVVVLGLGYSGIQVSARAGEIVGAIEVGVFAALAVTLIVKAGGHNTLAVFGTHYASNPHYKGLSGVAAGSVFTILAFLGFESAAPLAEETRSPRRTVGRAVVLSCVGIGLLYILTSYAATVFYGPSRMTSFVTAGNSNPWQNLLARRGWSSVGYLVVFLAFCNSLLGNANSGSNASSRTLFSMGRIRLLPNTLARLHPRLGSPYAALVVQAIITVGVGLWLGKQYTPYTAFALLSTIIVVIFVPLYWLINLSCIVYFLRFRRSEFNWLLHGVVPVLGILLFVPGFFAGAGIPIFSFISPLPKPLSYAGPAAAAWMVLGVAYLIVLARRNPQRLRETSVVFEDA